MQQQRYSPRYFKDMIVTFMQIENIGFNCFDYDKIVNLMAQKLETYTEKFEHRYLEVLSDSPDFIQKYNQIVEPLFKILDDRDNKEKRKIMLFYAIIRVGMTILKRNVKNVVIYIQ